MFAGCYVTLSDNCVRASALRMELESSSYSSSSSSSAARRVFIVIIIVITVVIVSGQKRS